MLKGLGWLSIIALLALLGVFGEGGKNKIDSFVSLITRFEAGLCCIIKDECVLMCGSVSSF